MKKIELLSPAGSLKNMRYAFAYGADAVYAGQPRYSLRVRENEFNKLEKLAEGIQTAHAMGKVFLVASNIAAHNNKVKTYLRDMEPVIEMKPDALIMSDPGLIMLVRENFPEMPIHLSVQANAINWATVKFWQRQGIQRVILSRELALEEVEEIRQHCPDIELEVFVHGALCIAYSGRCLLSGYMTHRDGNQGACTNSCRWEYNVHAAEETPAGDVVPSLDDKVFLLQEAKRPGEYMPIYEDEHGTHILNSKDLRAVQHVARLIEIGIDSLKIEGRTKSHFYAARTAQVYRRAIDDALAGRDFNMQLMDDLESLASRGYTEGFYRRHLPAEYQNYEQGASRESRQMFVGEVIEHTDTELVVDVKNKFKLGDQLEMMTPTGNHVFKLESMHNHAEGFAMDVAPGSGHVVRIPKPDRADATFGLLMKFL